MVPYAAVGPTDVIGRMVADFLAKDLKQSTVVENRPGAQGAIGAEAVARSDADGYTLLVVSGSAASGRFAGRLLAEDTFAARCFEHIV